MFVETVQVYVVFKGTTVVPELVGVTVNDPPLQIVAVWFGITGFGFTVTVMVFWQLFEFVYVIIEVPTLTPVTKPVVETVATDGMDEIQALDEAAVAEPTNEIVEPTHTLVDPVILGKGFTVTVALIWQPFELV